MKQKILPVIVLLVVSACAAQAQIKKGTVLIGASVGFTTTSNTVFHSGPNGSDVKIDPRIGYAIGTNSIIGIWGSYGHNTDRVTQSINKEISTTYEVSAFWRRYVPIQNKLGWFAEVNAGYFGSTLKQEHVSYTGRNKTSGLNIGAIPGLYYQVLPRLIVFANAGGINYNRSKEEGEPYSGIKKNSSFNVSFFKNFGFGVDFIIGKKSQG